MKIAFGCDHGGFPAKSDAINQIKSLGHEVIDFGTYSDASCDYPDYAEKVAESVSKKECDFGVLICGTGIGIGIVANKVKNIRCAHVTDEFCAEMCRRHNDANIISMGARISKTKDICKYVKIFLSTPFDGDRHVRRIEKITAVENKYFK